MPRNPWHVRDESSLQAYVESLADEEQEWLLALFVDDERNLLAVDTVCRSDVTSCIVNLGQIFRFGYALKASGFILVHNHPSGDPRASLDDIRVSARVAEIAKECELPLLEHFIVAKDGMRRVVW